MQVILRIMRVEVSELSFLRVSAVLVIQNGQTRLVNVKNQDTITKILDMVPDMVDKISGIAGGRKNKNDDAVDKAIKDMTE